MQHPIAALQSQLQVCLNQLKTNPQDLNLILQASDLFFQLNDLEQAIKGYEYVSQFQPFNTAIFYKLGLCHLKRQDFAAAIEALEKVLQLHDPNDQKARQMAKTKLAKAYKLDKQYDKSRKLLEQVLQKEPNNVSALSMLGELEQQAENTPEAHALFLKVIQLVPDNAAAFLNVGNTAFIQKDFEAAIGYYQKSIDLKPNWATPYREMARACESLGQVDKALVLLKTALQLAPNEGENYKYLVAFYRTQGKNKEALELSKRWTKVESNSAEAWFNVGSIMKQLGIIGDCMPYFEKSFELKPTASAAYELGSLHSIANELDLADHWFQQALTVESDYHSAIYELIINRTAKCDWSQRAADKALLLATLQQQLENKERDLPLPMLSFNSFDLPMELHRACNIHFAQLQEKKGAQLLKLFPIQHNVQPKSRLKIGYISPDFRDHAVGRIIAQLFKHHDRNKFSVYGYTLTTAPKEDIYRATIEAGFDVFRDFCFTPSLEAAQQIVADGIDILIDLGGHTAYTRPEIVAMQPAPIQAHFMGYPDTTGANYIQYMLADPYLVPETVFDFYTEKVVHLPHAFLGIPPTIPDITMTKAEMGLPEKGVVFAAFNRPTKIEPEIFEVWMNILKAVDDSVLWLSYLSEVTRENIVRSAQKAGVNPDRIIFAPWQPYNNYLKMHQLCDLFLDTWHYSAGATSVAAISMGLPILTVVADNYTSRMGASILAASGLEELICPDLATYQDKAIALAQHPTRLAALKQYLLDHLHELPLFDNQQFARNLETAYWQMWETALGTVAG